MARDALAVLWRVRDAAVTSASVALAAARSREAAASRLIADHAASVSRERSDMGPEHMGHFIAWLSHARVQAESLAAALLREQAHVSRLQQVLAARRTEAEIVSKVREQRKTAMRLASDRRDQAVMDEAAGRAGAGQGSPDAD